MFARITHYKMKEDSIAAATTLLEELKPQIMAMPGVVHFINAMDETGAGYVVSVVDSKETSDANNETVQAMWGQFAGFLEQPPTPEGFDVIADWHN
ncbi:hypothetical protein [Yoonia litorea]|uniref:Antibiotic biosynthesis monooxygenase n=1 Tax=Yoonia litorea TaxID=1123755 RepID=A0A1I6MLH4_9RHOB|nr:hypothetical protein [Yoonia litorea]SFS16542.1 hypothetical protein SAMN05444714_2010 [Yoonia litorea]